MPERRTHYSIIIPVYNGAEHLEACLTAILNQDYPRDQYEIIVVNDGSTDGSPEIAARFPVRIVHLPSNQGRIAARNAGAEAATHDMLVFNDVRVVPEGGLLRKADIKNYQPLMPGIEDGGNERWGFPRFFHLLRCRLYHPYYPLDGSPVEVFIRAENFDTIPKGTGCFVCDRDLWLQCQPASADKTMSDDTRILREIVNRKPILRTTAARAFYRQRRECGAILSHLFHRGPLFADYYLRKGGRYRNLYGLILCLLGLMIAVSAIFPAASVTLLGGLLLAFVTAILYLGRIWSDSLVVGFCLPAVVLSFGLGILKWQVTEWVGGKRSG
ncbi:MAG: glycosyltransferase [Deltaproteobacteria bacterium]|nr:glycosyltransferase [Deltaproteobacteria bacterium]